MPIPLEIWWNHFDFLAVMLLALALHFWFPVSVSFHPMTLLTGMAENMQRKVHPSMKRPPSQQKLAGMMATLLLLLPFLIILQLLISFSEYPHLFEVVLVWLSLDWHTTRQNALLLEQQVNRNYKLQARERIGRMVLRDTDRLSQLGITKAGIESVLQRGCGHYFAVLFWYVSGGAVLSFGYRGLRTLVETWNPKQVNFRYFAATSAACLRYLDALPARLMTMIYAMHGSWSEWFKYLPRINGQFPNNSGGLILACAAPALKIRLSGPAFYAGKRLERERLNLSGREPQARDLRHAVTLVQRATSVWLTLLLLISLCYTAISIV